MVKSLVASANAGDTGDMVSILELGRSPGVGNGNPVFLSGKFQGQKETARYSPWCRKESDTTEHARIATHY